MMLRAIFRTYHEPMPSDRDVLDAVSNICSSVKRSLKKGTVSNCTFTINMRKNIFNYLMVKVLYVIINQVDFTT